tara:strand:+ start:3095 stop:3667 length:573 start_codon:yes stop_codon:yes gene_type:complete
MPSNIKLVNKITSFKDVQTSLNELEKILRNFEKVILTPAELDVFDREGKTGETRTTKNIDGTYSIQSRTNKGWDFPSLKPHYDSGWTSVASNNNYTFKHYLGSKFILLQVYLKDSSNNIFLIGADSYQYSGGDYESGISIFMRSDSEINIGTGNDAIFIHDNTELGNNPSSNKITAGDLRILAWKVGISN